MKRPMIALAAVLVACGGGTEPPPSLVVNPLALSFSATGGTLASQSLGLASTGSSLQWTAAGNAPWLAFSPAAGMTPSTIVVSPSPTGLAGGSFSGAIAIQPPGAGTPQSVPVSLTIPTATGGWSGNNSGITLSVVLAETGGTVSGSGTLAGTTSLAVTVAGTHAHPTLSLTFAAPGFQPSVFIGSYTASNTVSGTINGSGFVNFPMTLTR